MPGGDTQRSGGPADGGHVGRSCGGSRGRAFDKKISKLCTAPVHNSISTKLGPGIL
jgi:hypothetical protein